MTARLNRNVRHEKMRHSIIIALLSLVLGCTSRPTPQEVLLRADGATIVNGAPMTEKQLRDLAIARYRKHGSFPLTIRADATVPLWRLAHIADIFRAAGVWRIDTGRARPNSPAVLYPTCHTWTNEWKWHGLFAESNSIASIRTSAGVNVRLLPEGALLDSTPQTMQSLLSNLASLSGTDRARVVVTSETNAPHNSLMAVLDACQKHALDPLFVEHWDAEQAESTVPLKAAPSASSTVR